MTSRDDTAPLSERAAAASPPLVVGVEVDGDSGRVQLSGELDLLTAGQVTDAVSALVADGHHRVSIDLAGLTFLDVVGINTLLRAHHLLAHAGGRLTLTSCRPMHLRLFALMELDSVFHLGAGRQHRPSPGG